jgi:hypothetical protein
LNYFLNHHDLLLTMLTRLLSVMRTASVTLSSSVVSMVILLNFCKILAKAFKIAVAGFPDILSRTMARKRYNESQGCKTKAGGSDQTVDKPIKWHLC